MEPQQVKNMGDAMTCVPHHTSGSERRHASLYRYCM